MKLKNVIKKINCKNLLCILITIGILLLSFVFERSFYRFWESLKDFGLSIYYYFTELFKIDRVTEPTINNIGQYDLLNDPFSFISIEFLKAYLSLSFSSIINWQSLVGFLVSTGSFLSDFLKIMLIVLPLLIVFVLFYRNYFSSNEREINSDSRPLKIYKFVKFKVIDQIVYFFEDFIAYLKDHRYFYKIWIAIFLFYFNFYSILIEAVAFYLYIVFSFDFGGLFVQFYKLILDLLPLVRFVPFPVWIVLGVLFFNRFRKKIAYKILMHHEMMNRGLINELGLSSLICSPMGKGKTTLLTDIGLSQTIMFRDVAFQKLLENDLKFPNFTFSVFENEIKRAISDHEIYNLATCKKWINAKELEFKKTGNLFDYDYLKYGLYYYDGCKEIFIFEMLKNYVQLFFIYTMQSSLMITNFSVREDDVIDDIGFFPRWHNDFFSTNPEYMEAYSRHSHILDFDMLRLGKTVIENNKYRDAFEFGVVLITEGGKERGNMLDNRGVKKDSENANQLNDLFNSWLKMVRHSATVDHYPFVKVIFDEQRPESLGADAREVCEKIIFIEDKKATQTPLMLFGLETMIYDFLNDRLSNIYSNYRYYRGDNTLFMYLLKSIWSKYSHYYERLKNVFSYHKLILSSQKGTLDGTVGSSKYYISHKKIYSKRFATDAFNDYFMQKSILSEIGLNDIPEFESESATLEELASENSYFIRELIRIRNEQNKKS